MRITPMDIQQQQFKRRLRGFDLQEVDSFLELVAAEFKEALQENSSLKDEVKGLERELAALKEKEKGLQAAFISAQGVIEEMKANSERQAKLIIAQAELESEKILQRARVQSAQLQGEINQLKRTKAQMEHRVKSFIESLSVWLDAEKESSDASESIPSREDSPKPLFSLVSDQDPGRPEEEKGSSQLANRAGSAINEIISEVNLEDEESPR